MVKGRRAADRRREREQALAVDPNGKTKEVTTVSPGQFDPRAETVLNAGEAPPSRPPVGGDGDLAEDTARLGSRAEVTAIREAPDKPPLYGGRLKVLSGVDLGLDVIVPLTPCVIGRKGDVKLTDPTASRSHLELRFERDDRVWVIEDLGSTTGTLLNGAPLEMATELKHGDVIALGQSELRFSWAERLPEDKPEPEAEPPKERTRTGFRIRREDALTQTKTMPKRPEDVAREQRQKRHVIAAIAACALVVLLGAGAAGYFAFVHGRADPAQVEAQVKALLDDARRFTDDGDLAGARARLEAVLALAPKHAEAESLLRMLESDVEAARALKEARGLFERGEVEEALAKLRYIPDSSRFAKGREELKADVDERAQKESARRVEARIDEGDLEGAEVLLEAHLARWPKDVFANAMRDRIVKLRNAPPPEDPVVARARDAFQRGEAMEARLLVEQAAATGPGPARRYLEDLDRYEQSLASGRDLLRKKDKRAAVELDRAHRLLPRLGRRTDGPVAKPLEKLLADALYLEAISARQKGDDCAWAKAARRASTLARKDAKNAAQLRAVDQKAKAALTRAEARAGHDAAGARRIAATALCLAESGSPTHRALQRLSR